MLFCYDDILAVLIAVEHNHFQSVQCGACVAVGKIGDHPQQIVVHIDMIIAKAPRILQRPRQQLHQILRCQRLQHKHLAPGKQSGVDLKRRIFRCRADQDDAALLYKGKESILLSLIKAMDFIDEKNRLLAHLAVQLRFIHDFFDFLNPAGDRTEIHEMRLRALSDDPGQRRFAHAWRPPEIIEDT